MLLNYILLNRGYCLKTNDILFCFKLKVSYLKSQEHKIINYWCEISQNVNLDELIVHGREP